MEAHAHPESSGLLRWLVIAGGTLAAVAAVSVFVLTADRPLWLDEAWSANLAAQGPAAVWRGLATDNGPPLYYLLLSGWSHLVGTSETALRALSLVLHLGTGAVLGVAGARAGLTRGAALVGALMWLLSPPALTYAATARMYALLGLLVAASCALWLSAARAPTTRTLAAWASVTVLGLLTHYWFAFVIVGQGAGWLVLRGRHGLPRLLAFGTLAAGVFAALWGPTLYGQLGNGSAAWIPKPELADLGRAVADYLSGRPDQSIVGAASLAVVIAIALGAAWRGRTTAPREAVTLAAPTPQRHALALMSVGLVTLLVPFARSYWQPMFLVGRYTLAALPAFALALAYGLRGDRGRWAAPLVVVAQLATGPLFALGRLEPYSAIEDRLAATLIAKKAGADDAVVVTMLSGPTILYTLEQLDAVASRRVTFPASLATHPAWADDAALHKDLQEIEREAEALVASLGERPRHVFVAYGHYNEVGAALVSRLEARYRGVATIPFAGSTFNMILVFDTSAPPDAPPGDMSPSKTAPAKS